MSLQNVPPLPRPFTFNNRVSVPPPSPTEFHSLFGHVLPPPQTVVSYWGTTTYYLLKPSSPNPSPTATPRKVILIHGIGTPSIGLIGLATRLAASSTPTTVLIYDFWGHGLSSTPLTPHVYGLFHFQILHLLTHLKWESAHFLGFSLGGIIAASFTQHHSELIESLALVAPAGLLRKANQSWWTQWMHWGGFGIPEWFSTKKIYDFIGPGEVPQDWEETFRKGGIDATPNERVQVWEKERHVGHMRSLVSVYRYGGPYDGHEAYRAVAEGNVRSLTLLGELDGVFEKDYMMSELKALGWKDEIRVVEGVGHGVISGKVEVVVGALLEFWDGLEKGGE